MVDFVLEFLRSKMCRTVEYFWLAARVGGGVGRKRKDKVSEAEAEAEIADCGQRWRCLG